VIGYRRSPQAKIVDSALWGPNNSPAAMGEADHVHHILPQSAETQSLFDAGRFGRSNPAPDITQSDAAPRPIRSPVSPASHPVTSLQLTSMLPTPETIALDHPLGLPANCFITPHTGGGHADETLRIVKHFVHNLQRFERGRH